MSDEGSAFVLRVLDIVFSIAIGLIFGAFILFVEIFGGSPADADLPWATTEGVVDTSEVREMQGVVTLVHEPGREPRQITTEPRVRYSCRVAGKKYESTRITQGLVPYDPNESAASIVARYSRGSTVTVYYDREEPSRAFLEGVGVPPADRSGSDRATGVKLGLFFLVLGGGWFFVLFKLGGFQGLARRPAVRSAGASR